MALAAVDVDSLEEIADPSHAGVERGVLQDPGHLIDGLSDDLGRDATRPTAEGDPITTIYRVLPDGSVEVFIDSTQDKWGSGRWEHLSCRTLAHYENGTFSNDFGPDDTCVATPLF